MFGDSKTVFSIEKLIEFVRQDACNKDEALTLSLEYLCTYFAHGADGNKLFYTPPHLLRDVETFETIDNSDMKKRVFDYVDDVCWDVPKGNTIRDVKELDAEGKFVFKTRTVKVSLKKRFYERCSLILRVGCDPRKPRFYSCPVSGAQYINLSQGFLHPVDGIKPFAEYPEEDRRNVQLILDHIKNVWNSGDGAAYQYCEKWLAHALTGHKMPTALFLNSGEGTGKSCVIEFLINHVIGSALGLITARSAKTARRSCIEDESWSAPASV